MIRDEATEKVQKILARRGVASRRGAEALVAAGRVKINGVSAQIGSRASDRDVISVDGAVLEAYCDRARLLLYNKPEGIIVSRVRQTSHSTVFEHLPVLARGRWVSIGRLDVNSEGLLLLTNNGDLAHKMSHAASGFEKTYLIRVNGSLSTDDIDRVLNDGCLIDNKKLNVRALAPHEADTADARKKNHWYKMTIVEGRNRIVRRFFNHFGLEVSALIRIQYGDIRLPQTLRKGQFCEYPRTDVVQLLQRLGLSDG